MNKTKINFRLVVGVWNIEITDENEKLLVNNKRCSGAIRYKERTIYIDSELNENDLGKVIRHELTHAVLYETQIELKEHYTEEDVCEFMAKYGEIVNTICEDLLKEIIL